MGELTEEQMIEKLNEKDLENQQQFLNKFEIFSKKEGYTFGAKAIINDDGTISARVLPVKRPNK